MGIKRGKARGTGSKLLFKALVGFGFFVVVLWKKPGSARVCLPKALLWSRVTL